MLWNLNHSGPNISLILLITGSIQTNKRVSRAKTVSIPSGFLQVKVRVWTQQYTVYIWVVIAPHTSSVNLMISHQIHVRTIYPPWPTGHPPSFLLQKLKSMLSLCPRSILYGPSPNGLKNLPYTQKAAACLLPHSCNYIIPIIKHVHWLLLLFLA